MSWHGDDDEVDNDSVGWFNARDYAETPQAESAPNDDNVQNDSFGWFNARDYRN